MSNETQSTILRSEIDSAVSDLSAKIASTVSIDKDSGVVSFDDNYVDTILGEEFTLEQKAAMDKRMVLGTDATHLAVGEAAIDAFNANKDLERISGLCQIGGQHLEVNISRSGQVRNVKTQEVTDVYATGATKLVYRKPTSKAGFKRVRNYLQQLGEETLA